MSDPAKYRTRDEVERVRTYHDPIELARTKILEAKLADEAALKEKVLPELASPKLSAVTRLPVPGLADCPLADGPPTSTSRTAP